MDKTEIYVRKLSAFKAAEKFSAIEWEKRGLNPSEAALCQILELKFNDLADQLIQVLNSGDQKLKPILDKGLNSFIKSDYDTEEREFICNTFLKLAATVDIDLKEQLNKWLYGRLTNLIFRFFRFLFSKKPVDTISQPCSHCSYSLDTYIISKQIGIPNSSFFVAKCNNCNSLNLLKLEPNIKELKFGNYELIETLNKNEYSEAQAELRLDQIKNFRKM